MKEGGVVALDGQVGDCNAAAPVYAFGRVYLERPVR